MRSQHCGAVFVLISALETQDLEHRILIVIFIYGGHERADIYILLLRMQSHLGGKGIRLKEVENNLYLASSTFTKLRLARSMGSFADRLLASS